MNYPTNDMETYYKELYAIHALMRLLNKFKITLMSDYNVVIGLEFARRNKR